MGTQQVTRLRGLVAVAPPEHFVLEFDFASNLALNRLFFCPPPRFVFCCDATLLFCDSLRAYGVLLCLAAGNFGLALLRVFDFLQ